MVARQMREKQEASQNEVNHGPSSTFKVRNLKKEFRLIMICFQSEIVIQQLELQRPLSNGPAPDFNIPVLASLGLTLMGLILTGLCVWDSSRVILEVGSVTKYLWLILYLLV